MNDLGLGWAQPCTSPSGSLPPLHSKRPSPGIVLSGEGSAVLSRGATGWVANSVRSMSAVAAGSAAVGLAELGSTVVAAFEADDGDAVVGVRAIRLGACTARLLAVCGWVAASGWVAACGSPTAAGAPATPANTGMSHQAPAMPESAEPPAGPSEFTDGVPATRANGKTDANMRPSSRAASVPFEPTGGAERVDANDAIGPNGSLAVTSAPSNAPTGPVAATDPELARLLALGEGALRREDYNAAVDSFRKARRHAPHSGAAVAGLVAARFGQLAIPTEYRGAVGSRDVKELLTMLDAASAHESELGAVHLQRARLLVVLGLGTDARASLDRARALLPSEPEVHSLLAIVELSEGHVAEALRGFATASELEPNDAQRLSNWGTALLMHGDVQEAISVFRRAVSLAPGDARARGDLGTALLSIGDVNQAMPHLVRACELAPTKATFMNNLGYAHQLQADLPGAKAWYDKALAADPKLGSAWINLGTLYAAQGRYDAAEQAFRKALALEPRDPRAIANLEELASLRKSKSESR